MARGAAVKGMDPATRKAAWIARGIAVAGAFRPGAFRNDERRHRAIKKWERAYYRNLRRDQRRDQMVTRARAE